MSRTRPEIDTEKYDIKIVQWRKVRGNKTYTHKGDLPKGADYRHNAGLTEAWIFDKKGNLVAYGEAKCGKRDAYNKRIGRDIAIGRAAKELEKPSELRLHTMPSI